MIARFTKRHAFAALMTLGLVGMVTPASPQVQAPPPSPQSLLIAKQILELKNVKGVFTPLVRGVVEKVRIMVLNDNFMWQKDIDDAAAVAHRDYDSRVDELIDQSARIYANHFSEAELRSILTFYQSPLGQKVIAEEPKALDESMAAAGKWGDNLSVEVMGTMRAELKKRGHDL